MEGAAFHYVLGGFVISAEHALPLPPAIPPIEPDVVLRVGAIEAGTDGDRTIFSGADPMDVVIAGPGGVRCRVCDGSSIVVAAETGADAGALELMLSGPVLGVLAIQRGRLPIHASAIVTDGGAVAFLGRSGAGKSTLVAAYARAGRAILCDDLLIAGFDEGGAPVAWPTMPRIKLWRGALDAVAPTSPRGRVQPQVDKYFVDAASPGLAEPLPLRRLYLLEAPCATTSEPRRLSGLAALRLLMRHSHGWGAAAPALGSDRLMRGLARLVDQVEVHAIALQHGFDRLPAQIDRIEAHLHGRSGSA